MQNGVGSMKKALVITCVLFAGLSVIHGSCVGSACADACRACALRPATLKDCPGWRYQSAGPSLALAPDISREPAADGKANESPD